MLFEIFIYFTYIGISLNSPNKQTNKNILTNSVSQHYEFYVEGSIFQIYKKTDLEGCTPSEPVE